VDCSLYILYPAMARGYLLAGYLPLEQK